MYAFLLAAAQGIAISNSPAPPVVVLPPQSVPPAAMQPSPPVVRRPQSPRPTQSLFSIDDYPYAALGTGARGVVAFRLTVGPDGRVVACAIRQSSGSAVLDATTCNILRRRAHYMPAMDSNGNPVAGTVDDQVEWKLPSR